MMKKVRCQFVQFCCLILFSPILWAAQGTFNPEPFEDGKDYFSYSTPLHIELEPNKVRIEAFFDYDCRQCLNALDILTLYYELNRHKVSLEEHPVATDDSYLSAQIFYSLHQLGREDVSDLLLFETAEAAKYAKLSKLENLYPWLQKYQINQPQFEQIFSSEQVEKQVQQAIARTEKYGVFTVPFVVLNGKYVLTISTLYNDDYTFAVLDYLVNKLMKE